MTSEEPIDGCKESNQQEKEEVDEPKRSFRAEYARKSHNNTEKKRKDKIAFWINKIYELLPKDPRKESKNGILEKAFHYMVHLKETNDKLIYGNATQVIGEELRLARRRISQLEDTNAVYYKLLKMSGITPNNIPLDVMNSHPVKNMKQDKSPTDQNNSTFDATDPGDQESDTASDTTEVISDSGDVGKKINQSIKQTGSTNKPNMNPLFNNKMPLLVVNQNQDNNAPRISLSNGSQLQIRPSPNVQILGNGALAIDSSGFNQGPIILGSTLLSPPQPTTLVMHNGQLLSLVNQPQPAFVYTPGAGFVLTSSTPINNTSINVPDKNTESPEKVKRKVRPSVEHDPGVTTTETIEVSKPRKARTYQKSNVKQVPQSTDDLIDGHAMEKETIVQPPKKKRGRPFKVTRKANETSDKLTTNEMSGQNNNSIVNEKDKRSRPTTVIERVADSPVKRCDKSASKMHDSKVATKEIIDELGNKKIITCDDMTNPDLEAEDRMSYSFRQNGEANCEQDQLPLLLGSLSEDHEMSTESVHSVSNSSLPTFLSLSPSDHLTDFLSKTSDHGNGTTRSPRYSSPMNRINTNAPTSQASSVIISNQGIQSESPNCHGKDANVSLCVDENYSNSLNQHQQQQQQHHHHHQRQQHSVDQLGSNNYQSNTSNDSGQGRLYSAAPQETRRRSESDKSAAQSNGNLRKSSDVQDLSSTSSTTPTVTTTTTLDSNAPHSSSANNHATSNQERNFLPYSAESLLRQQPQQQQQSINNMPTSVPINSIYHVQSNATVEGNIDFANRGVGQSTSTSTNANHNTARPTISYSASRLIHTPPVETDQVNQSDNRQKSHETSKVVSMSGDNASANNQTANVYNAPYSIIRTARGNNEMDSDLLQSNHQQQHHQHNHQQQQHSASLYRSSPQAHDPRTNQQEQQQQQHQQQHSSRDTNAINANQTNQSQQILHQQRNYSDNHLHHHQHQQQTPLLQQPSQLSRGQTQAHQPNQSNSTGQGQMNMKTSTTAASSPSNNNPSNSNNTREIFNHYPYGTATSDGSTSSNERTNSNLINFTNNPNEGFIENNSSTGTHNNFLPPFAPPINNCQPTFGASNNRRSNNSSATMLTPFGFTDSSFSSESYGRQGHPVSSTATSNSTSSSSVAANFTDTNRRIGNSGHFVDPSTPNNPSNNYFIVHNHHVAPSSLPNSNNPSIFSTSSTFPSLISNSSNSNYDNNGYNLTCPPRSSGANINSTANAPSTNTLSNPNLHHHHHHHHPAFYIDSTVTTLQTMHASRRPSEPSSYSVSSGINKSTNNTNNNGGSLKTGANNSSPSTSSASSKQSVKSNGGSSSKSNKKAPSTVVSKSRPNDSRSVTNNNPSTVTSYSSMSSFVPPPPPPPTASAVPSHSVNRSVATSASSVSSSTLLNISSSERSSVDTSDTLFRPQSQSNASGNMQPPSTPRPSGAPSHALPVGHSSSFLPNFNFFPDITGSINANENFAMTSLSALKFNSANHLTHHPNPNAPFTHSSALQGPGQMDNGSSAMSDNSTHQNIYGHHSRIETPHHNHVSFMPLIGTSPRTLK